MQLNLEQKKLIRSSAMGHSIIRGVAGSGKTTVAVHRISFLLDNYCYGASDKILMAVSYTHLKELPDFLVTDGCIYVSANIKEPGKLLQHGQILHIVFGVRDKAEFRPELKEIQKDLCDSHIDGTLSENIRREALEKLSLIHI